ncbi:uncharacterized protein LOC132784118 [Drosophila nasuta]|uniref:uncharacterized protein LOC132784118 n=1 Tax=Drosophila nasuta TaxID=42062 RepID=UPI00295EB439|nr:uncharacterized protein LOC132784118 [Drosophila nasuta]
MEVHAQLLKKANGYKPWLIDVHFDVCSFLNKNNHPFVKIVYGIFRPSSNINHTCPYVGPIIMKDLYLKPNSIPLPMPSGEYCFIVKWKFDKKIQAINKFFFEYLEDS